MSWKPMEIMYRTQSTSGKRGRVDSLRDEFMAQSSHEIHMTLNMKSYRTKTHKMTEGTSIYAALTPPMREQCSQSDSLSTKPQDETAQDFGGPHPEHIGEALPEEDVPPEDDDLPQTSAIPEIDMVLHFVHGIKNTTLENDGLEQGIVDRIRNPVQTSASVDKPGHRLLIQIFAALTPSRMPPNRRTMMSAPLSVRAILRTTYSCITESRFSCAI
ncbi:hypothetical protein FA95DRAFT_1578744 [Auriscalpium vulgare]|uniref:Uncharacterized protein n=1 Tax=Auriscalpium vulgare TaxID=40419 RepID=A0ACB8R105_9AGAM|nr:hypothetical protein FA95DRAFT_1578744 [Auriscalpium vulgare]